MEKIDPLYVAGRTVKQDGHPLKIWSFPKVKMYAYHTKDQSTLCFQMKTHDLYKDL